MRSYLAAVLTALFLAIMLPACPNALPDHCLSGAHGEPEMPGGKDTCHLCPEDATYFCDCKKCTLLPDKKTLQCKPEEKDWAVWPWDQKDCSR